MKLTKDGMKLNKSEKATLAKALDILCDYTDRMETGMSWNEVEESSEHSYAMYAVVGLSEFLSSVGYQW
jgi:hypothetical protein